MFELLGTIECRKSCDSYLIIDPEVYKNNIVNYIHTGIIKGKWNKQIVQVVEDNNIEIDFTKRGFYKTKSSILRRFETIRTIPLKYQHKLIVDLIKTNIKCISNNK